VRAIIGRFLEHARIYVFHNDGNREVFASSADLMSRNMFKRVEICFPVENKKLQARILHDLDWYLQDNSQVWLLQPDGSYQRSQQQTGGATIQAQAMLLKELQA
jgi:polyphosphate kinase